MIGWLVSAVAVVVAVVSIAPVWRRAAGAGSRNHAERNGTSAAAESSTGSPPALSARPLAQPPLDRLSTARRAAPQPLPGWAEALPSVVWKADAVGQIVYTNKAWLRNFRTGRPLKIEDLVELLANDDTGVFIGAWDAAQRTRSDVEIRCRMQRPGEPAYRWIDLTIRALEQPVFDDGNAGSDGACWVGTMTDVHEAMAKIENAQGALREERRLRERAERLALMKDEFLSTVSHELRSPLNAITGWSEILLREAGLSTTALHAVHVIQRNARAQAKLISSLQQLTAMLTGKVALTPVQLDLDALVDNVVRRHAPAAQAKGIVLAWAPGQRLPVHADVERLTQVVTQLIDNALKFTAAGGRVDVQASALRDTARLVVEDNGIGIAADRLPQLFDCLRPVDDADGRESERTAAAAGPATARQHDRLCLGLTVARGLAELQDGTLAVDSPGPGLGSTFTLTLPLQMDDAFDGAVRTHDGRADSLLPMAAPLRTMISESPLDAVGALRILVLDPDHDRRELLIVALSSLRGRVQSAGTLAEALHLLHAQPFDVLIQDRAVNADPHTLRSAHAENGPRNDLALIVLHDDTADAASPVEQVSSPFERRVVALRRPVSLRALAAAISAARSAPDVVAQGFGSDSGTESLPSSPSSPSS